MANEQNLKPCGYQLSREEAKKGGRNSGRSRRRKRSMQELAQTIARTKVTNEDARAALADAGIVEADMINDALVVFSIFSSAISGDMKAVEKWQALTGQLPAEEQPQTTVNITIDPSIKDLAE